MTTHTRRRFIGGAVALACGNTRYAAARADEPLLDVPLATDAAGRLLAPAYVNGHGPYQFMVDSGASHCAISRDIVTRLALPVAGSANVSISSTTGRSTTQAVQTESFEVGSLRLERLPMPVIDGATVQSGVVGANALIDKRLDVDFKKRRLILFAGTDAPARQALTTTVPVQQRFGGLLLAAGSIRAVGCKFIVDTGAQVTIGNLALARRLDVDASASRAADPLIVQTPGATIVSARLRSAVPIDIGQGISRGTSKDAATDLSIAFADLPVFAPWHLTEEPAALLGMDFFARLSRFVIDYRHSFLSIQEP